MSKTLNQMAVIFVLGSEMIGTQALLFVRIDKRLQGFGGDITFGNIPFFQQAFNHRQLVGRIQNAKVFRQPRVPVMNTQKATTQPMKSAKPHRPHIGRHH